MVCAKFLRHLCNHKSPANGKCSIFFHCMTRQGQTPPTVLHPEPRVLCSDPLFTQTFLRGGRSPELCADFSVLVATSSPGHAKCQGDE